MNTDHTQHILIIGGVAGGASAAARARRHSETAHITLIERGPDVSFANCGLPYHIGGEIADRDRLALQTPESLKALLNLDVQIRTEAIAVSREKKEVTVRRLDTGAEETLSYDSLILAPGASPIVPPLEGIEHERILSLRNLQDMDKIKAAAETTDSVLVIGAGFIGLEMAEQLRHIDKKVQVVELQEQILPQVDPEIVAPVEGEMTKHGIELILGDGVASFSHENDLVSAQLNSGKTVSAGLVVLSIGVKPESDLAKDAGLELGPRGHIVVNEYQQTSDPSIYAAGDVCETLDPILGTRTAIPLGGPANRQGRTAADHIFMGNNALAYPGSIGTSIVRVFDQVVATTGYNEKRLLAAGVDFDTVTINAHSHAGYYPGALNVTLKLLWRTSDGLILGASAVGADGIDKRMDVIATAITGKLTIDDLCNVELSYSPPFGSAKDPVNIAAFAACNIRDGLVTPALDLSDDKLQLIDVRPAEMSKIRPLDPSFGAKAIPVSQLRNRLDELDQSRPVTAVCALGKMSYFASRILTMNGFEARSVTGGLALNPDLAKSSNDTPGTTAPQAKPVTSSPAKQLDCTGIACPGPIMKVKEAASELQAGEILEVKASDGGFANDLPAFCSANQYEFLGAETNKGIVTGRLRIPEQGNLPAPVTGGAANNDTTMVVFSQEMDKVMAGLVIANGTLAMGGKATLFFTFWGLNALRKPGTTAVDGKTMMDKMFGMMLPQGTPKLPLSNMNMGGMGMRMMKSRMAAKNLPNLDGLLEDAVKGGARLVACAMSMEAMGIHQDELIDGVEMGGVAEFLAASSRSGTSLFI
ncbi:FAD-dependent oxidoreductase [Verrucomicrobiaceae bacterium N1E253]|uniref:FAD-dependent oxidoreductase n=1 Tax=Oceaniferula marina TaxID=2748318 RepID=A0A851GPE8_9BACT|nr:FAD-dependent oxidoreductase [Oceaniferula marina]NWK56700.1 FAD-dependent oxidoreductase [Oceaniferula marina]